MDHDERDLCPICDRTQDDGCPGEHVLVDVTGFERIEALAEHVQALTDAARRASYAPAPCPFATEAFLAALAGLEQAAAHLGLAALFEARERSGNL